MQKSEFVGVRLTSEEIKAIEERAKEAAVDKSTALRQLLKLGIKQFNLERALDLYKQEKISLEKAAEIADISIWEMMDIMKEKGITSKLGKEDLEKGMKNIRKIFKIKL